MSCCKIWDLDCVQKWPKLTHATPTANIWDALFICGHVGRLRILIYVSVTGCHISCKGGIVVGNLSYDDLFVNTNICKWYYIKMILFSICNSYYIHLDKMYLTFLKFLMNTSNTLFIDIWGGNSKSIRSKRMHIHYSSTDTKESKHFYGFNIASQICRLRLECMMGLHFLIMIFG